MTNYQELLQAALTVHSNAQQSVRGPSAAKRVADAIAGFAKPFSALAALRAKIDAGQTNDPRDEALLAILREIESQRSLLQSAIARAQSDDDAAVKGVVVQQSSARALTDKQEQADAEFLAKVDEILDITREDLGQPSVGV